MVTTRIYISAQHFRRSFFFASAMKIKGPVWDFFIVTKRKLDGTPLQGKCKTCGWVIFANAKRMSEHACKGRATLPGEYQSVPENIAGPDCSSSSTPVSLGVGNSSGPSPATSSDALHTSPSLSLSEHLLCASQHSATLRRKASFNFSLNSWTTSLCRC